jgi:hypothetical protein
VFSTSARGADRVVAEDIPTQPPFVAAICDRRSLFIENPALIERRYMLL